MNRIESKSIRENDEITIKGLIDIFLPKMWLIVLLGVLFAGAFGFYSKFVKDDTYTSTAKFIMVKTNPQIIGGEDAETPEMTVNQTTGINANEIEAMRNLIVAAEDIMKADDFLYMVKEELENRDRKYEKMTVGQIKGMFSIDLVGEATVFSLTSVHTDPEIAFDIAEVVSKLLPSFVKKNINYSYILNQVQTPMEAENPDPKNVARNTIIGFLAGILLALVVVFVISKLDIAIRTKEKIESNFDIPVIGIIPHLDANN